VELIITKDLRPTIPVEVPTEYANLIRECWAGDPLTRPRFPKICNILQKILPETMASFSAEDLSESGNAQLPSALSTPSLDSLKHKFTSANVLHNLLEVVHAHVMHLLLVEGHVWASCGDGKIYVYEYKTGKKVTEFYANKAVVTSLAIVGPKQVWSGSADATIILWSALKFKIKKQLKGHLGSVNCILAEPDDKQTKKKTSGSACVWSGDSEGNIIIWKGESKYKKFSLESGIYSICVTNPVNEGLHMWIGCKGFVDIYVI